MQGAAWQRALKRSKSEKKPTVEIEKGWERAKKKKKMNAQTLPKAHQGKTRAAETLEWVNTSSEVRGNVNGLGRRKHEQ